MHNDIQFRRYLSDVNSTETESNCIQYFHALKQTPPTDSPASVMTTAKSLGRDEFLHLEAFLIVSSTRNIYIAVAVPLTPMQTSSRVLD